VFKNFGIVPYETKDEKGGERHLLQEGISEGALTSYLVFHVATTTAAVAAKKSRCFLASCLRFACICIFQTQVFLLRNAVSAENGTSWWDQETGSTCHVSISCRCRSLIRQQTT